MQTMSPGSIVDVVTRDCCFDNHKIAAPSYVNAYPETYSLESMSGAKLASEYPMSCIFEELREYCSPRSIVLVSSEERIEEHFNDFDDNQPMPYMITNGVTNQRNKHIDIRYRSIEEWIVNGVITLKYRASSRLSADLLTKNLGVTSFITNVNILMGLNTNESNA